MIQKTHFQESFPFELNSLSTAPIAFASPWIVNMTNCGLHSSRYLLSLVHLVFIIVLSAILERRGTPTPPQLFEVKGASLILFTGSNVIHRLFPVSGDHHRVAHRTCFREPFRGSLSKRPRKPTCAPPWRTQVSRTVDCRSETVPTPGWQPMAPSRLLNETVSVCSETLHSLL